MNTHSLTQSPLKDARQKRVALVILNYNGRHFLEKFLPGVVLHNHPDSEVIIADNASTDGSIDWLQKNFPQMRIIRMEKNTGFATGYNVALQQVESEYYILLNSDVEVTPGWMAPLIELMDSNPDIAACQPKIKSYHDRKLFEYAGAGGGFIDTFGYPFCRGRVFDALEADHGQYDDTREVFWASGACLCVRAKLYREFGGFDDHFFAHMEEIDLCWRFKNAGYRIFYCGASMVYHVGGGTLPKTNPRKTFLNFRNGLVMMFKNLPTAQLFPVMFLRMVLDGVAGARFLFSGSFGNFMAVLKSHFYLYANAGLLLKKRRETRKRASAFKHNEMMKGSIVWAHFVNRKRTFKELDV